LIRWRLSAPKDHQMTRSGLTIAVLTALLLTTTAATAGPKDNNGKEKGNAAAQHCPPGLAKKNPPCIPPGQVGKGGVVIQPEIVVIRPGAAAIDRIVEEIYAIGMPLPDRYVVLFDPRAYPQWPRASYARLGDFVYLIDPESRRILAIPEPLGHWVWAWDEVDFTNCPPGLAKKNPPCVPPGQAMKGVTFGEAPHRLGEVLPLGHQVLFAPIGGSSEDDGIYTRLGDSIYRIDRDTGAVLQLIGTLASLLG
jgi:hypothetical protein